MVHIKSKSKYIYVDLVKYVDTRFHKTNYEFDSPLSIGANKKVIKLMTDEFAGRIMKEFVALRPKKYSYLTDDSFDKSVMKHKIKFAYYKNCLEKNETILKSLQRLKSEVHNIFREKVNKILLRVSDHKRLQMCDGFIFIWQRC